MEGGILPGIYGSAFICSVSDWLRGVCDSYFEGTHKVFPNANARHTCYVGLRMHNVQMGLILQVMIHTCTTLPEIFS